MMDLTQISLSEAADLIERREISPVELTHAHLERIEALEPRMNCFITICAETARVKAHQAEAEISSGEWRGPLHGIPLALKDLYETQGVRTTAGSKFFADYTPEADGAVAQKLDAAGAILLGKLNMHEIALGVTNVNPHYGPCRNPWDLERVTGGSSGGSAAALAAGLCPGSMGSDTGGSIRIPASLCGIVGLKPTFGRISSRGMLPLSWNLDHAGPMARRVRDVALLLQTCAGYDPADAASADIPVPKLLDGLEAGMRGLRAGLVNDEFFNRAEPEVLEAVRRAAAVFEQLGAQVNETALPGARQAAQANGLMVTSDAAAFHRERLETRPQDFGPDVLQRLTDGARFTSSEYVLARRTQAMLRRQFEQVFTSFDILLTPTTPIAAPLIVGPDAVEQARLLTRFTAPFNLTGLPAVSLPCGFTQTGLPIGLQLIAAPWAEAGLLRAAYAYEEATGWYKYVPTGKVNNERQNTY